VTLMTRKTAVACCAIIGCAVLFTMVVSAQQITLKPGAIANNEFHRADARDFAYCEIAPVLGKPPNVMAQFYNSSGPGDRCPAIEMAALDPKKLAAELGAEFVYINPTPQTARRHWVMDQLWFFKVGETVDFHGVRATWAATMSPEVMNGLLRSDFVPGEIHRDSKYLYAKGSTVFLLRSPDGKTWVMQSYTTEVDKDLSFDQLSNLASELKLPDGFKFEVKTLTRDLTIDPRKADDVAHIIRDNLHDIYGGCGFDGACNYIP
jgi:hypothetical protein